jgi:hypothetical protein
LKLHYRATFVLTLVVSVTSILLAQEAPEAQEEQTVQEAPFTIADIARQEREKRKEFAKNDQTIPIHTSALSKHVFTANILFMDSKEAIEKWVLSPLLPRPGTGLVRQVKPGMKFYMPFVVTNYRFPNENMYLSAQLRITDPEGKTIFEAPKVSGAVRRDPRSPHVIVLNPVMDLTFDEADQPGTYMIRVMVFDHAHNVSASTEASIELVKEH